LIRLEDPLNIALAKLQHHIEYCGAATTVGELPEVHTYTRDHPSTIRIEAHYEESYWRVSTTDNGQGFEQKHAASIFEVFRRLHGKDVPGSGIGLATWKRIIERQGGGSGPSRS
jgi:light-regulated signal transduction histidine kinase (bacteriophytochrome)